jgi:hypothetical protein
MEDQRVGLGSWHEWKFSCVRFEVFMVVTMEEWCLLGCYAVWLMA